MRGAQEVDVGLLHQLDVFLIGRVIHVSSCLGMMVVTVHTTQFHVLAVDFEHFAHNLHAFHAKVIVEMLNHMAFTVAQLHTERIKVGLFGRPKQRLVNHATQGQGGRVP